MAIGLNIARPKASQGARPQLSSPSSRRPRNTSRVNRNNPKQPNAQNQRPNERATNSVMPKRPCTPASTIG